jgi:hypothetical protein
LRRRKRRRKRKRRSGRGSRRKESMVFSHIFYVQNTPVYRQIIVSRKFSLLFSTVYLPAYFK